MKKTHKKRISLCSRYASDYVVDIQLYRCILAYFQLKFQRFTCGVLLEETVSTTFYSSVNQV